MKKEILDQKLSVYFTTKLNDNTRSGGVHDTSYADKLAIKLNQAEL